MGKLIKLHWSAWLILGLQFLFQLAFLFLEFNYWLTCKPVSPFIPMYFFYTQLVTSILIAIGSICYLWGFVLIAFQKKNGWVLCLSPVLFFCGAFLLRELHTPQVVLFNAGAFISFVLAAIALIVIAGKQFLAVEIYQVFTVTAFFLVHFGIYYKNLRLGMWLDMNFY